MFEHHVYPSRDEYYKLYARYQKRDPGEFFKGIDLTNKRVLDLCCGGGRLAFEAVRRHARFVYGVDSCERMLPFNMQGYTISQIMFAKKPVDQLLVDMLSMNAPNYRTWDVIVCQQAINYWYNSKVNGVSTMSCLKEIMAPDGIFIFNTFNTDVGTLPHVKNYSIGDINYLEVSYRVDSTVFHIQAATGLEPHVTCFDWISPEQFRNELPRWFDCEEIIDGPTTIWRCRNKN